MSPSLAVSSALPPRRRPERERTALARTKRTALARTICIVDDDTAVHEPRAHGAGPGFPVIRVTGAGDGNSRAQAFHRGVGRYLEKVLTERRLLEAIAHALEGAAGPAS